MELETELQASIEAASVWRDRSISILQSLTKGSSAFSVLNDVTSVLSDFSQMIPAIVERQWSVLSAIDNQGNIQSLAVYQIRSCSLAGDQKELFKKILCTAPWNIKKLSSLPFSEKGVSGGGVLLMHALTRLARQEPLCKEVFLYSSPTGMGFYKKIGMRQTMINRFAFDIKDEKQRQDLEKVVSSFLPEGFELLPVSE